MTDVKNILTEIIIQYDFLLSLIHLAIRFANYILVKIKNLIASRQSNALMLFQKNKTDLLTLFKYTFDYLQSLSASVLKQIKKTSRKFASNWQ